MPVKITQKNPNALKKIAKRYKKDYAVAVGYPASETSSIKYPTTKKKRNGKTREVKNPPRVVDVAAVNEFGSASLRIPARPFMALSKKPALEKAEPLIKSLTHMMNLGKMTKKRMAKLVGQKVVPVFQKTITDLRDPPNSALTIKLKESSNPLIETTLMRNTLTFGVREMKK